MKTKKERKTPTSSDRPRRHQSRLECRCARRGRRSSRWLAGMVSPRGVDESEATVCSAVAGCRADRERGGPRRPPTPPWWPDRVEGGPRAAAGSTLSRRCSRRTCAVPSLATTTRTQESRCCRWQGLDGEKLVVDVVEQIS